VREEKRKRGKREEKSLPSFSFFETRRGKGKDFRKRKRKGGEVRENRAAVTIIIYYHSLRSGQLGT